VVTDQTNGRFIDILLVEDNPGDARRIELMLESAESNYRLHTAVSVKSALHQLATITIHLMLLDLSLPDSQGINTIRTFHAAHPWIPIIVLTGLEDDQLVADAATAGAHDYLLKQELTTASLLRVLRYALERHFNEEQIRASQSVYRRQARELNLLNRIISTASASNDEQTILADTCLELAQFYNTSRALILLHHHEDSIVTVQAEHYDEALQPVVGKQMNLDLEPALAAISSSTQTLILPQPPFSLKQFLNAPPDSKLVIHPLYLAGKAIGFFVLNLPATHALGSSDVRLIATVSEEIGLALEKIRLYGRLQAHAHELEDQVQRRTQALADANEQLKSLDKLKSQFVSDVSHELRNPITNLTLYLELLEFAPPDKQTKYLTILRTQVKRLSNLVEQILTLSRLENNSHHPFQPVNLNALVHQVVVAHQLRAQNKQLALHFFPQNPLPPVWGEPNQITQIVTNLLDNALNYTDHGSIKITTGLEHKNSHTHVILGVSDTGTGIHEEEISHIFERFYRGTQIDRDKISGTGLGLGIVNEIVAMHNGRIHVKSTPNQGSHFTVSLPAAPQTLPNTTD
jgi:signal transduction histidine kinase/DNA-binding response OmpR family regulator